MPADDRERWNARYRDEDAIADPSPFLSALDALLPRRGRALDVAGGSGRNALWLARRGLDVTLADVSDVALERAVREARLRGLALETLQVDLEAAPLPRGPGTSSSAPISSTARSSPRSRRSSRPAAGSSSRTRPGGTSSATRGPGLLTSWRTASSPRSSAGSRW